MKSILKFLSMALAITLMLTAFVIPQFEVSADYMTMRDITAYDLVAEMNVGVSIGNSMDSACGTGQNETAWGNPKITKELIVAYKNAGFNTIRLPVTWRGNMDSDGNPNTAWLDRTQELVDMILSEGLYCIINTHHEQNWLNTNSSGMSLRRTKFSNLWTAIAKRFKNYGDHLLFEGFNEILKKEGDWSAASNTDYQNSNNLAQLFVDTVRATDGKNAHRVLIISTYGAIHTTTGFELPKDTVKDRLAVEFHCYYPQAFCFSWGNQTTWGSYSDNATVESYCKTFYNAFVSKGVPVILGEFGAINKNNSTARCAYASKVASTCKQYKIKPIWWDNGTLTGTSSDSFGLINRYTYEVYHSDIISALVENSESVTKQNYSTIPTGYVPTSSTTENSFSTSTTNTTVITNTTPTTTKTTTTTTTTKPIVVGSVKTIKIAAISSTSAKLYWSAVSGATKYVIYRSDSSAKTKKYKVVSKNSYVDENLKRGKVYTYKVIGYTRNEKGEAIFGKFSNSVKLITLGSNISKVNINALRTVASISVSKVFGAHGYEIKYSTKSNMKGAKIQDSSSRVQKLSGLKRNTKYYVTIRAYRVQNGKIFYTATKKASFKTKK